MIKATELQIGDYVLVSGTPRRVESIAKKKIGYHINPQTDKRLYYARLRDVEPIKVTSDILLNNGFVFQPPYIYEYKGDSGILFDAPNDWENPDDYPEELVAMDSKYFLGIIAHGEIILRTLKLHKLMQYMKVLGIKIDWKL